MLSTTNAYPAQNSAVLERTPTLLVDTALAVISPTDNFILVFGISQQLNLEMAVWRYGVGWSALRTLGRDDDRLFAHSRLAAFCSARNRAVAYVGGVTNAKVPRIYTVRSQKNDWGLEQIQQYPKTSGNPPAGWHDSNPNGPFGPAFSYVANSFGDVAIYEGPQGIVFAATGVDNSGGAVLVNHIQFQVPRQCIR